MLLIYYYIIKRSQLVFVWVTAGDFCFQFSKLNYREYTVDEEAVANRIQK